MSGAAVHDFAALRRKLERARWFLLSAHPFYGTLSMNLRDVFDEAAVWKDPATGAELPTCCTDGAVIRWHPAYLAGLDSEETPYGLAHETLHPAHGHLWRLTPDAIGNIAGDMAIEKILRGLKGLKQSKGGVVCPPEFEGLAEEEIERRLRRDPGKAKQAGSPAAGGMFGKPAAGGQSAPGPAAKPGQREPAAGAGGPPVPGKGNGKGAGVGTSPGASGEQAAGAKPGAAAPLRSGGDLRERWQVAVANAVTGCTAAGAGSGAPGDLLAELKRVRHQAVDWRSELADFVRSSISERSDWSRAARRHAWQRVLLPRRKRDELGLVVFARDTSGSISYGPRSTGAEFSALVSSAVAEVGCRGLVLDWGTRVVAEHWLEVGEECPLTAARGGGTHALPVFRRVGELVEVGETVAGVVVLTDLELADGDELAALSVDVPVLWLSTTAAEAPWGRTVRIEARAAGD